MNSPLKRILAAKIFRLLHLLLFLSSCICDPTCGSNSSLIGTIADLSMIQHQVRGTVEIIDDCTFKVDKFDMIAGKNVYWWGSQSTSLSDMLSGWPLTNSSLQGTFNTLSMQFVLENTTWDDINVLSLWSKDSASDYGHIVLRAAGGTDSKYGTDVDQDPGSDENTDDEEPEDDAGDLGNSSPPPAGNLYPSIGSAPTPEASPASPTTEVHGSPEMPQQKRRLTQPTMFDNCIQLSRRFRLRWTVDLANGTVDLGLEAAVDSSQYLAFGWADPTAQSNDYMINADVIVAGVNEDGIPFAEDYFVTARTQCNWDREMPQGVCPDSFLGQRNESLNNIELVWGQRVDGVTLIRVRRPFLSEDTLFDNAINVSAALPVIWAFGAIQPATNLYPHTSPTFHTLPRGTGFGAVSLLLDTQIDQCQTVLSPKNGDLGLVLVADRGSEFKITSGLSVRYPNPPSPGHSLFINGHEAPVLKVERGVEVVFSVQAGYDNPVYITNNPIGGNLKPNETIYAGGAEYQGVPAVPFPLTWTPNYSTPDQVYYQSYTQPKMGWIIKVVDGGLSDMYSYSAVLADEKVTLFWSISGTEISFAVRGERPSGYLALGFGSGMVNSFSYVGWVDNGTVRMDTYYIDSRDASGVHEWTDNVSLVKCISVNGHITFEFTRPLKPANCSVRCNVLDVLEPVKFVWAMGTTWSSGELSAANMHSSMSSRATVISLGTGVSEVETLQPVLAVHGFMMFLSWGILMPAGMLAARYLRNQDWFRIHLYTQSAGIAVMMLGLLFAVGELRGFDFSTTHSIIGLVTISIGLWQPINGYFRPQNSVPGEPPIIRRIVWRWTHRLGGNAGLIVGAIAMLSGLLTMQSLHYDNNDDITVQRLIWLLGGWIFVVVATVIYFERCIQPRDRRRTGPLASSDGNYEKKSTPVFSIGGVHEDDGDGEASRKLLMDQRNGGSDCYSSPRGRTGNGSISVVGSTRMRLQEEGTEIELQTKSGGTSSGS